MENNYKKSWWKENRRAICYSVFIMIAGTLLHFAYEWSGMNSIVAMFAAVNESVWEHLKLFFVPAFLFTACAYCGKAEYWTDYLWCQTKSILAGLLFLIVFYFTYTGITRQNYSILDIGSFYVAAVIAGVISGKCQKKTVDETAGIKRYAGVILLVLWALFVWFSYSLPEMCIRWLPGLFIEP